MSGHARGPASSKGDQPAPEASAAVNARFSEGERLGLSAEEQRVVLACLVEGVVTPDDDGCITHINQLAASLDERAVLGSRWVDWLDEVTRLQAEEAARGRRDR